jgi:predicted phosphodiesterase
MWRARSTLFCVFSASLALGVYFFSPLPVALTEVSLKGDQWVEPVLKVQLKDAESVADWIGAPRDVCPTSSPLSLRLAVIGDTRADADGLGYSAYWLELIDQVMSRAPHVLIHLGDWVKSGTRRGEWRRVMESLALIDRALPLLSVRGNHDRGPYFSTLGFGAQTALRVSRCGPILIYLFDTEGDEWTTRQQVLNFYEAHQRQTRESRAASDIEFVLWVQHRPLLSRGNHGSDERGWAEWLTPVIEGLGVDLTLSGHDHDYERFCPTLGAGLERRCDHQGVHHIVSGGGASFTVPLPGLSREVSPEIARLDAQQSLLFRGQRHALELVWTPKRLQVFAWGTPRYGISEVIDDLDLSARP